MKDQETESTQISIGFVFGLIVGAMSCLITLAIIDLNGFETKKHTIVEVIELRNGKTVVSFESNDNREGDTYRIILLGRDTVSGFFRNGKWE